MRHDLPATRSTGLSWAACCQPAEVPRPQTCICCHCWCYVQPTQRVQRPVSSATPPEQHCSHQTLLATSSGVAASPLLLLPAPQYQPRAALCSLMWLL
jgi:hypothetical protein